MRYLKTILILLVIGLLLTIETVSAVPANPEPFTLIQQDGSYIQIIQVGDEREGHSETPEGYTILEDESDGFWKYAKKDKNGMLISSGLKVGYEDPVKLGLEKHLRQVDEPRSEIENTKGKPRSNVEKTNIDPLTSGESSASSEISAHEFAPLIGIKKSVVILINFTDKAPSGSHTPSFYNNLLFSNTTGSMNNYYKEVSYNNLNVTGIIGGNKWYKSAYNESYYGKDFNHSLGSHDNFNGFIFELAREALVKADADIDFSMYDTNSDGVLNSNEINIIIIHAGCGEETGGCSGWSTNAIWSHKWEIYGYYYGFQDTYLDGKRISRNNPTEDIAGYTMLAEGSPMGTFAHEFGHDLGLPDLYDTTYHSDGVGNWDIMGFGSWLNGGNTPAHISVWGKYFLGWINPTKVTYSFLNENISAIETNDDVYMLLDNPGDSPGNLDWTISGEGTGEYFLVENRRKTGFDAYLPGEGLLIWHIDETRSNNDNTARRLVNLEVADGLNDLNIYGGNQGDAFDPWYNNITGFAKSSNPNSRYYNGSASGVSIQNIGLRGAVMTADLMPVPGQNTAIQSTNSTFGIILKGQEKTINYSIILRNIGDINATVEAHFSNNTREVFGLISSSNDILANLSLGPPGALVSLNNTGADVQVVIAPPGVTVLEARLVVPNDAVTGDYSGIITLTFSDSI